MLYRIISLEEFFISWQSEYINLLESCSLLHKFLPDSKKLLVFFFISKINEMISDRSALLYHDHQLSPTLEIFNYYDYDTFNKYFSKIAKKIQKLTGKVLFLKHKTQRSASICGLFDTLDGEIQDEILGLNTIVPKPREIKDFLSSLKLGDIFSTMTWKIY